ncbi:MAG: hypothetical protein JWM48_1572 [Mycobacterium sp.]|nr:hypothetical protein [Mycobacterium sp.]
MPVRLSGRDRVALGVVAASAALTTALWLLDLRHPHHLPAPSWHLAGWLLALMFVGTEAVPVHIQIRRETQSVSLTEIPLVLGLLYAAPVPLLLAKVCATVLVMAVQRRQPPIKMIFNVALLAAETSLALFLFNAIASPTDWLSPRTVLAVYVAVVAAAALNTCAIQTVVGAAEGGLTPRAYAGQLMRYPPWAAAVATIGFVAAYALTPGPAAAWVLTVALGALLLCYRVYGRLRQRHESLERLFHFTQALPDPTQQDTTLTGLLEALLRLFRADHVSLVLLAENPADAEVAVVSGGEASSPDAVLALHSLLVPDGAPSLVAHMARDGRSVLPFGLRDAIAVPLRDGGRLSGSLVLADRVGDVQTFTPDDLQLLQTVAIQSLTSLRNGQLVRRLRHDATHDRLTRLANRAGWEQVAEAALAAGPGPNGCGPAVVLLDLDGFKDVNDTLGHQAGDLLLIEVASRLVAAAGAETHVARFGGDEFAVLVPDADQDTAVGVGDALVRAMQEPLTLGEVHVEVQASTGVALAPVHGRDLGTLLKRADLALYSSKRTSRRVTVFHAGLEDQGPNRLSLMADLRRALHDGEVVVAVQPKALLATGHVTGVEALARWNHPVEGPIPPDVFIPLAESSGMIRELTASILDQSLVLCAAWNAAGNDLTVAVNLSPRALLDEGLLKTVTDALERHGVPAHQLILEITESSVIADPEAALEALHALRDAGISLSVDDFGTGYSSLSYLKRLPVQEVKIDRSFVRDLVRDPDDALIVRAVADLGRNLGLTVVAEGVEDEATWHRLRNLGVDTAQGYHLSRPLTPAVFARWLRQHEATLAARSALTAAAFQP